MASHSHTATYVQWNSPLEQWGLYVWLTGQPNTSLMRWGWTDFFSPFTVQEIHMVWADRSQKRHELHLHTIASPAVLGLQISRPPLIPSASIRLFPHVLLCHIVCKVEDKQLVKARASSHSERVINGRAVWGRALMTIDLSCGLQHDGSTLMYTSSCESQCCTTSPSNSPSACCPQGYVKARLQRFTLAKSASFHHHLFNRFK